MLAIRKHIALLFILCTLLVQLPKNWIHDCHVGDILNQTHSTETLEENCNVCNHPALLSDATANEVFITKTVVNHFEYHVYSAEYPLTFSGFVQNKAPPVLPC